MSALEMKLVEYFLHPAVQARHFNPAMFWEPLSAANPFGRLRVDPAKLEALFVSIIQPSMGCGQEVPGTH